MVTMPLALLVGAFVVLMVRKGGWPGFPIAVAVMFGLVLGSTDIGAQMQGWIAEASRTLFAELSTVGR